MPATPAAPAAAPATSLADRRPPLWVILAITVSGIMTNTMITAGLPDILEGVGADNSQAGLLVAIGSVPGVVLAALIGLFSDRWGRREVVVPCLVIFSIVGGLGSLATSLPMLLAIRFAQGAASAGLVNLGSVIIADHWQGDERARVLGLNAGVLTVCLAVFPLIGGLLVDLGGWRAPFYAYLVGLAPAAVAWRRLPRHVQHDVSIMDQVRRTIPHLRRPEVSATIGATVVLFVLIFGMVLTLLPVYADEEFGMSAGSRGILIGLPAVGTSIAAFTIARVKARVGLRRVLLAATIGFTLSLATASIAPTVIVLGAGMLVFGLAEGSTFITMQDHMAGNVPDEVRGTLMATQVSGARLGQVLGPLLVGGLGVGLGTPAIFAVGAVIAATLFGWLAMRAVSAGITQPVEFRSARA